jgi:uncharacterized damage-inducible protein DinB
VSDVADSQRKYPDMWVDPEDDPRQSDEVLRGEKAVLVDYLRAYRLTFRMKCEGLDAEQLARRSVPPSTMSLLGLLRHLAAVEHSWFRRHVGGVDIPRLFKTPEDRDHDFNGAVADADVVAEAWAAWEAEVAHAEQVLDGIDDLGMLVGLDEPLEIRDLVVHMVEEYARHCGHADLLRECIDGRVGQ